jgi:hypothetical protein
VGSPHNFCPEEGWYSKVVHGLSCPDEVTIKNKYQLPRIDDLFDQLHGVCVLLDQSSIVISSVEGSRV